jgi:cytochrome c oxidase subunit 1
MPFQSIYPFLAGVGILIGAVGVAIIDPASPTQYPGFWGPKVAVTILGGAIMFVSIVLWALEGNEGYHIHLNPDGSIQGEDAHSAH